jgi:hypothetical protein
VHLITLVEDGHSNYSKDVADLIFKWSHKLYNLGVKLLKTQEIDFLLKKLVNSIVLSIPPYIIKKHHQKRREK